MNKTIKNDYQQLNKGMKMPIYRKKLYIKLFLLVDPNILKAQTRLKTNIIYMFSDDIFF